MDKAELRLTLAKIRQRQRAAEREMERIRGESRSYQRLGFGQDIKEIQLSALQDQRLRYQIEAQRVMRQLGGKTPAAPSAQSWLLLPVILLLVSLSSLTRLSGRGAQPREPRGVPSERTVRY